MENDGANLEPQIEALLNVERQMRQAGDVAGTQKAVTDILQLCFDAGAWKTLTDQIVLISKRRGQLKQGINLALKFGGMMKKDTNFNSNKGVFFGIPISSQKFRTSEPRFAIKSIQSVMQVGLEKKKEILPDPNSSKGLLGFDVVSESELRERGFMGMRKTKLG
ncbi:hypothetical protein CASFOL_034212 [Castilleja foliolosa]|uniref:PSMD12/CSN4-like N-terminal domain-containing protein n=1 Tax=Castilleja foliolosa TaxID=1961234 RepID=A0ABD3BYK1_9LAMI